MEKYNPIKYLIDNSHSDSVESKAYILILNINLNFQFQYYAIKLSITSCLYTCLCPTCLG